MKTFDEVFEDRTKYGTKIKTNEYQDQGLHLIIDQGQKTIAGYTDLEEGLFEDVPAIIFGDHTRTVKYVEMPFFIGADGVKILKSKIEDANYKYLYYALKNVKIPDTGYNRHFKWLKEVMIEYPDLIKQQKIVDVLDKIEKIIAGKRQQLEKLDDLIKSRFVEMFGDPVSNPMKWVEKKLIDVCDKLTDGTHFSPKSFETGDYMYITAKNIKITGFDFSNITYVPAAVHDEIYSRCNPEYGDVLYTKDGVTTGIAMINTLHEPFALLSSVALLKQNRNILCGEYLCGVLNNNEKYVDIRKNMGGAAITRLTIKKLNEIQIPIPPLELQEQFAAFVHQVDKSKATVQKSLDETQKLFDSLMQQYFG